MNSKAHSFIEYWKLVDKISVTDNEVLLFRGHANYKYELKPSVFRNGTKDFERDAYQDIMINSPEEFNVRDHLNNLTKMQHFGTKTRLLDFTYNPLDALYFAAECEPNVDGQVIFCKVKKKDLLNYDSDKALMLSCLASFSDKDKEDIKRFCEKNRNKIDDDKIKGVDVMERFLHEIRKECPAFRTAIIGQHLLNNYFIRVQQNNERLKSQNGLFLIFGLKDKEYKPANPYDMITINIDKNAKKKILADLKKINISTSTVYPTFERRSMELMHNRVDWTSIL